MNWHLHKISGTQVNLFGVAITIVTTVCHMLLSGGGPAKQPTLLSVVQVNGMINALWRANYGVIRIALQNLATMVLTVCPFLLFSIVALCS